MAESGLCSMTGFGRAEVESPHGRFSIEIKSVNGRYQEIRANLPPGLNALETPLRNLLKSRVKRGKIDCRVRYSPAAAEQAAVRLNDAVIRHYLERLRQIGAEAGVGDEVTLEMALRLPGATEPAEEGLEAEACWGPLSDAARAALDQFQAERAREGAALAEQILSEAALLKAGREKIDARRGEVVMKYREKLAARIAELEDKVGLQLDPGRLELEVTLFADKADVSEELVRLAAHLERLEQLVANREGEPVGKALDFLVQEILREVNTIASKLRDLDFVTQALEMKGAVERIREQIQNVE